MSHVRITTGIGYDVHRLASGRKLRLCGVEIPFHLGLEAHSDGDVAIHALCDALLGAAALGDIGKLFPPSAPQYKDADSRDLLKEVVGLLHQKGFTPGNVDITIIAEEPKIGPYVPQMRSVLSLVLGSEVLISIKATTNERLGFAGRQEGIAALATCLLYRN